MDTYKEVIDEYPDDISTYTMEDCVNNNQDDASKNILNEGNNIGVDDEEG